MAVSRVLQDEFSSLSWEFVTSSNVESIAYVSTFERLWVRFLSKPWSRYTVYVYFDVDESTWEDLRSAPSKGGMGVERPSAGRLRLPACFLRSPQ